MTFRSNAVWKFKKLKSFSEIKSFRNLNTERYLPENSEIQIEKTHLPVMVNEVIDHLNLKQGNTFLDMTFGAGGHSLALLEKVPELNVIALDRDPIAHKYIAEASKKYQNQITPALGKFSDVMELLKNKNIEINTIDGILFDLGASPMQLDTPERGFSIKINGPLDMRMDCNRIPDSITAADVLAYASEKELFSIFKYYGEEKKSRKIARAIVQARQVFRPISTTKDLNELIESVCFDIKFDKLSRKAHTASKIFQALRIFVNNELNELNNGINLIQNYLKPGGRAVVLTFHSLEDGIVKRHFSNRPHDNYKELSHLKFLGNSTLLFDDIRNDNQEQIWSVINKKVIVPSDDEIYHNPRSRSAKLRAAVKVKGL